MRWDTSALTGPDDEDWRVPVSELEERQSRLSNRLAVEEIESVFIEDPVELYWLTGSRQNSAFIVGAEGSEIENTLWVRRSLSRAIFEGGEDDCPHLIDEHPRMGELGQVMKKIGCKYPPAMLAGKVPHGRWSFISSKIAELGQSPSDCTGIMFDLRERKSDWELDMIRKSGQVNLSMFEAIRESGGLGKTELEMAGAADEVSRAMGFGGRIRMRKWPMDCDRVVIASGRSGSVPSYFDSAVGGLGSSPISSLGAGFSRVKEAEPVLVDIVHVHRGYVSDCTRMFCHGSLPSEWESRLDDMVDVDDIVRGILAKGQNCSDAWEKGKTASAEMGYSNNLMGMPPNQASFLGHSVGLELDETPVIAKGFDKPLGIGSTMAIEPKVIFEDGAIGIEDTWVRSEEGMECLTAGDAFPRLTEW